MRINKKIVTDYENLVSNIIPVLKGFSIPQSAVYAFLGLSKQQWMYRIKHPDTWKVSEIKKICDFINR